MLILILIVVKLLAVEKRSRFNKPEVVILILN